jgi:hypothetical protein
MHSLIVSKLLIDGLSIDPKVQPSGALHSPKPAHILIRISCLTDQIGE